MARVGWSPSTKMSKAPSIPATMSKQYCRMLQVERSFDKIERYFDIVAVIGNNVERVFREISSFRQSRNKLHMFHFFRLCRKDEISRKTRSILLSKATTMSKQCLALSKQHLTLSKESFDSRLVAFDNVGSTLLLVWTGLYTRLLYT